MKTLWLLSHTLPREGQEFSKKKSCNLPPASTCNAYCFSLFVLAHLFPTMAAGHLLGLISLEPLHPCSLGCFTAHSPRSTFMTPSLTTMCAICTQHHRYFQLRDLRASHDPRPPAFPVVILIDYLQKYTYLTCPTAP